MARLEVKVHPRAKRTGITGRLGEVYKLALAAPPVDGRANDECVRYMADLAGVARSAVRIVRGATSRTKLIEVSGVSDEELNRRIASASPLD